MITELEIDGFKSFDIPGVKLRPTALNFIVGANASGKTNLITALRFLQKAVTQDVEYAVNELGGCSEVRNKILRQNKERKPVRLCVKLDTSNLQSRNHQPDKWIFLSFTYEIKLDLRSDEKKPIIESESLKVDMTHSGKNHTFTLERDNIRVVIADPMNVENGHVEIKVPDQEATRLALNVGFYKLPCLFLREIIGSWRFYNIRPEIARQPYKENPEIDLGKAGESLAVVLHKIEQDKRGGDLSAIVNSLKGAVPGFNKFKTTKLPVEGKWALLIQEEGIRGAMNPDSVSDGTIRLLALMVIAHWTKNYSSLIAIEEPENGIHPHLAEHVVNIFRATSSKTQCLITTHNPNFLDHLEPSEVILCDKISGFTQLKRASDVDQIDQFRKHFKLGELWVQGTLGGIL